MPVAKKHSKSTSNLDKMEETRHRMVIARCNAHLTQVELADILGVHKQYISKIESGAIKEIAMNYVVSLAKVTFVSVNYLVDASVNELLPIIKRSYTNGKIKLTLM